MKKLWPLTTVLVISVVLAACSGGFSNATPTSTPGVQNNQALAKYLTDTFTVYAGLETLVNDMGTKLRAVAGDQAAELKAMGEFMDGFKAELVKERARIAAEAAPEEAKAHYESLQKLDKSYQTFVDTLSSGVSGKDSTKIAEAFTTGYPKQEDVSIIGQLWQDLAVRTLRSKPGPQNEYLASATKVRIDFTKELNKFFSDFAKAGAIVPQEKPEIQKAYADAIKILNRYSAAWNAVTLTAESSALHKSYGDTITKQVDLFGKISKANDVGNQKELAKLEQERFDAVTESMKITQKWIEAVSAALGKIAEG